MLAAAGVPILKALQSAAETLNNRAMRADAFAALVLVREGAPIASALGRHKRFPPMLSMFARLGEQTGQLPLMLQRVAAQLSADVQRRAMQLATILEPLLIVAMGLVVMLIVLAVMLPIIQLNQLVRSRGGARGYNAARFCSSKSRAPPDKLWSRGVTMPKLSIWHGNSIGNTAICALAT